MNAGGQPAVLLQPTLHPQLWTHFPRVARRDKKEEVSRHACELWSAQKDRLSKGDVAKIAAVWFETSAGNLFPVAAIASDRQSRNC